MSRSLRTLSEQIADQIYEVIVRGEHTPGDRIREAALADQFGVSRAPVREALRILERDAVVRVLPNRGAHVTCHEPGVTYARTTDFSTVQWALGPGFPIQSRSRRKPAHA